MSLLLAATVCAAEVTRLKSDEQIVFYPTIGQRVPGQDAWRLEIRGCVFEPEKGRVSLALLRGALELKHVEMSAAEQTTFTERARLFLVDHERGKRVFVRIGDKLFPVGKSGADGNFAGEVLLEDREIRKLRETAAGDARLPFTAEMPPGDTRRFAGEVLLLDETGLCVISDIDDTIKITNVRDRRTMLRNTFLRDFQAVPGMAESYQRLACSNRATFHFVSASPWQLYVPIAEFVRTNGFPAGTFALRRFRWKDRSVASLLASPEKYKTGVIAPLLKRFPKRTFILIGDSGERDPEIYAALARKFPDQVQHILIRDVTGEPATAERYWRAFAGLPRDRWQIFREPREINVALD
ncbi:MAG TPA: phosphatase domain-containing protein [Verrucomicrobiae bacterium]